MYKIASSEISFGMMVLASFSHFSIQQSLIWLNERTYSLNKYFYLTSVFSLMAIHAITLLIIIPTLGMFCFGAWWGSIVGYIFFGIFCALVPFSYAPLIKIAQSRTTFVFIVALPSFLSVLLFYFMFFTILKEAFA